MLNQQQTPYEKRPAYEIAKEKTLIGYAGSTENVLSQYKPMDWEMSDSFASNLVLPKPLTISTKQTYVAPTAEEPQVKKPNIFQSFTASFEKGISQYAFALNDWIGSELEISWKNLINKPAQAMESVTHKSSDPAKQAVYDEWQSAVTSAKALPIFEKEKAVMSATTKMKEKLKNIEDASNVPIYANLDTDRNWIARLREANKQKQLPVMKSLTEKQNLGELKGLAKDVAVGLESTPYTIASLLPFGLGFIANYGAQSMMSLNQKMQELSASGEPLTPEKSSAIMRYAAGSALIEAGSEQIFRIGGASKKLASLLGKVSVGKLVPYLAGYLIQNGIEEGTEEVISGIGQGLLAKITTDKTAKLSELVNFGDLAQQFKAGAIMGVLFSTFSRNGYTGWQETRATLDEKKNMTVDESSPDDLSEIEKSIDLDLDLDDNIEEVNQKTAESVIVEGAQLGTDMPDEQQKNAIQSINESRERATMPPQAAAVPSTTGIEPVAVQSKDVSLPEAVNAQEEVQTGVQIRPFEYDSMGVKTLAEGKLKGVDYSIGPALETINAAGYKTIQSQSATKSDYEKAQGRYTDNGYIAFMKSDLTDVKIKDIKNAADKVGLPINLNDDIFLKPAVVVRTGVTKDGTSYESLLPEANKVANNKIGKEFTVADYTTEEIRQWAKIRDKALETLITEHGGRHEWSDEEIISKWNEFANILSGQKPSIAKQPLGEIASQVSEQKTQEGKQGIVAPGFAPKAQQQPSYDRSAAGMSPDTQESLRRNADVDKKASVQSITKELSDYVKKNVLWGSVTVKPEERGQYKFAIRQSRLATPNAAKRATQMIEKTYGMVNAQQLPLLKDIITFFDIAENAKNGLYKKNPLPHKMKSVDELITIVKNLKTELRKPENKEVIDAYKYRKKIMDKLRDALISKAKEVGKDLSYIKSHEYYNYNAVYEMYMTEQKTFFGKGKLKYLPREGNAQNYISNPIINDYLIINKMYRDYYRLGVLESIMDLDISSELEYDPDTGKRIVPKDYTEITKNEVIGNVSNTTPLEKRAVEAVTQFLQENNIDPASDTGKEMLQRARGMDFEGVLVVPTDIAENVVEEFTKKAKGALPSFERNLIKAWKFTKIRTPFKAWKYNVRNAFGDLDVMLVGDPTAIKNVPTALWQLYKYYYGNFASKLGFDIKNAPMLEQFIEKTGGLSGEAIRELGDIEKHPDLKFLKGSATPAQMGVQAIKAVWKAMTLEKFTQFREQVLRYSVFMNQYEYLENHNGKPKWYMASNPAEISSIKSNEDKAIKLATDLLGAYDDVSPLGTTISDHYIPFFRFKALNVQRYVRMAFNMFYSNPNMLKQEGLSLAQKMGYAGRIGAVGAIKLGRFAILASLLPIALEITNHLFAGDDEDKLPEEVKNQPHVTFPSWMFGDKARVFYLSNIGSYNDLLNMAGIDTISGEDIKDLFTGKKTVKEIVDKNVSFKPLNFLLSINPLVLEGYELVTGKQGHYFDPENPSDIKDRVQYVFDQAGFGPVWTWLAGLPQGKSTLQGVVANTAIKGDVAMWEVYNMMDDFYAENDISPYEPKGYRRGTTAWDKWVAAYYFKQAVKLNDKQAMQKYLADYVALGGDSKTMDSSLRAMKPAQFMEKKHKDTFFAQLTDEEKATFERADKYYDELMELAADVKWP
jgi:hypothetical protein